jgi:hypothetical protein
MRSHRPLPPGFDSQPFAVGRAREAGIGEGRLRGSDLERPFHGVRVPASAADSPPGYYGRFPSAEAAEEYALLIKRCIAYAQRIRPGQFFSHSTAARLWKCPLPRRLAPDEPLHVSVAAPGRAPRAAGVIGHQAKRPQIVTRFGLPVSGAADTWLSLGTLLSEDDLVAVADHLVLEPTFPERIEQRPHTSLEELDRRLAVFSAWEARAVASARPLVRQGAESRPETLLRLLLARAGLPEPELQADVSTAGGAWIARVDMLFREWKVVVEYDGEQHRTSAEQYARDEERIEALIRAGYTVIRIRKGTLFGRPQVAVARVESALRERGWRG